MRYRIMLIWGALMGGFGMVAGVGAHSQEAMVSMKTYAPITIDGKLDDWVRRVERVNWSAMLELQKGEFMRWIRATPVHLNTIISKVESGTISSAQDLAATVYTLWDEERLYVAAVVTDNEVVTQHEGEDIWQDDAVELWLDCRHDAVTHTLFQDDEFQVGFSPASQYRGTALGWTWRNPKTEPVTVEMQVASELLPDGYILEGSVPWRVLKGCEPSIGAMIGFNLSVVDKDEDQLWSHVTWSGQLHSDPSQFGHLYFVDDPVDLLPSDVFEHGEEGTIWGVSKKAVE